MRYEVVARAASIVWTAVADRVVLHRLMPDSLARLASVARVYRTGRELF